MELDLRSGGCLGDDDPALRDQYAILQPCPLQTGRAAAPDSPAYEPAAVAEAIVWAAEHPPREIVVGGAAKSVLLLQRLSPALLDRLMTIGGLAFKMQQSTRPDDGVDNLFAPAPGELHRPRRVRRDDDPGERLHPDVRVPPDAAKAGRGGHPPGDRRVRPARREGVRAGASHLRGAEWIDRDGVMAADRAPPRRAAVRLRRRGSAVPRLLRRHRDGLQRPRHSRRSTSRSRSSSTASSTLSTLFLIRSQIELAERSGDDAAQAEQGLLHQQRHRGQRGRLPRHDPQPRQQRADRAAPLATTAAPSPRSTPPVRHPGAPARSRRSMSTTSAIPIAIAVPGRRPIPACDLLCARDVEAVIRTTTSGNPAAFIAEPIQGVGGFITPPPEYFVRVKEILDRYGIPFICGRGADRLGPLGVADFGFQAYGVEPDVVVFAKGLANGIPIGGVIATDELAGVDPLALSSRPSAATRSRPPPPGEPQLHRHQQSARERAAGRGLPHGRGCASWPSATRSSATCGGWG